MNKNNRHVATAIFTAMLAVFLWSLSCYRKPGSDPSKLLTIDMVHPKDLAWIKKNGLVTEGEIVAYLFTEDRLKNSGVILSDKKIVVYSKEKKEQEQLENIFDLSHSHSQTLDKKSSVTVYRKDDTTFKCEFPGNSDIDNRFFLALRDSWRKALSAKKT